ncbi:MAG: hypothetical protein M1828_006306 [Chrysothrix sp. TS-e1954]|nr:MAG: hypothetical protein M1828_006306 [Chrysothrix sp. TS-e1954]
MSQVVTTFEPMMTLCGMALVPAAPLRSGPANSTSPTNRTLARRIVIPGSSGLNGERASPAPVGPYPYMNSSAPAPWGNRSMSYSVSESCSISRKPALTTVCATNITGIATTVRVTRCDQDVTFSTNTGYYLQNVAAATPIATSASNLTSLGSSNRNNSGYYAAAPLPAAPSGGVHVQTVVTYYIAPWQDITSGLAPTDVTARICHHPNEVASLTQCVDEHESMRIFPVTHTRTSTKTVDLTTTIHGPSRVIIEGYTADITERFTTISISTRTIIVYSVETVSTSLGDDGLSNVSAEGRTTSQAQEIDTASMLDGGYSSTTRTVYKAAAETGKPKGDVRDKNRATKIHTITVHPVAASASADSAKVADKQGVKGHEPAQVAAAQQDSAKAIDQGSEAHEAADDSEHEKPQEQSEQQEHGLQQQDQQASQTETEEPSTTTEYTTITSTYHTTTTIDYKDAEGGTVVVTAMTTAASTLVTTVDQAAK